MKRNIRNFIVVALIGIILDQIIKFVITNNLSLYQNINIIPNFFNLTYVTNEGAAWGILNGSRFFLISIAVSACILIFIFIVNQKNNSKGDIFICGLLISGIIGNLIDRIIYGYVIDYLNFDIFKYDFPVFNLADTFIVISAILMIINIIKGEKNELSSKKK